MLGSSSNTMTEQHFLKWDSLFVLRRKKVCDMTNLFLEHSTFALSKFFKFDNYTVRSV